MRAFLSAALLGAACVLASCAQLSTIERGSCGNAIVEPEFGEDCDSFPAEQCHPPDSKFACRFACDPSTSLGCPEGWGCGSDGVCRQPTATFGQGSRPGSTPTARLFAGDFDGDGRRDVAGLGPDELIIHFFDDADPFKTFRSIRPASFPSVGELTPSDPGTDVTFASKETAAISVLHGRSDRSLLPLPFSFVTAPEGSLTIVSLEARPEEPPDMTWLGDEPVFVFGNTVAVPGAGPGGDDLTLFTLPRDMSEAAGPLHVANLSDDPRRSPCDEVVLTWSGATEVTVLTPCKCTNCDDPDATAPKYDWSSGEGLLATVVLPPGAKATKAAIAADLNDDGHLDLVVYGASTLYAAYGFGDGKFASTIDQLTADPPKHDNKFGPISVIVEDFPFPIGMPLAIGHFNDDKLPDAVISSPLGFSLVLRSLPDSKPNKLHYLAVNSSTVAWTGARVGDFNKNGQPDIVAWSDQARDIQFLNGAKGGFFNEFSLRTEGVPALVRIIDMDGDFIDDLVFVDRAPGADDSLNIMFGRAVDTPEPAVQASRFPRIEEVVPTQFPVMGYDQIGDLIVLTKDANDKRGISIFQGSTSRQVQSPLRLGNVLPVLTAVGDFAPDSKHQLDVIAISAEQESNDAPLVERFWLVPMQGDAMVDPTKIVAGDALPQAFRGESALLAPVDLDGTATTQELVVFGRLTPASGDNLGAMTVARVKEADGKLQLLLDSPLQETPEAWAIPDSLLPYGELSTKADKAVRGLVRAADIDADGRIDVAAMGQRKEGDLLKSVVALFPNTGSGSLSSADSIRVPNNTGAALTGFTFVQADLDPALELVLLSSDRAWLLQVELAERSFSDPVLLEGVGGGLDAIGEDFDRDGIQDLVIVGEGGLRYHKGIAVLP